MTSPHLIVGVLKRVSYELKQGVSPDVALLVIATEIEKGIDLWSQGKARPITPAQASRGQLIGDVK